MVQFQLVRPVSIGLAAGFISGLFGVGGGTVVVPALILWIGLDQSRAHATSLATIVASASAAALAFGLSDSVDWGAALALLGGSLIGAFFAARAIDRIPAVWLARAFVVFLVASAIRMAV